MLFCMSLIIIVSIRKKMTESHETYDKINADALNVKVSSTNHKLKEAK